MAEGTPLEFASVGLLKTSFSTATDKDGNFILKGVPAGKYQLRTTYVGYENYQQEVVVSDTAVFTLSVTLIPLTSRLKEIVVTGTLKEVTKLQSVMPVDVYTTRYFQRNPTDNIWDALSNVNGFFTDVDNGVSNSTDIQINGLEGNYTMILIDGVPAMNGLAGVYALNALPISMVDKIEILKGAASTLYGSEAIAGVINIKTKNPANIPRFSSNVYLDSRLETIADLTASFRLKKASTLLAVSGQAADYRWDIDNDNFIDAPLTNRANLYNKWSFDRKDSGIANIYGRFLFEDRFGGDINAPGHLTGSDSFYTEWIRTYQWQAGFQYQLPVKERFLLQADYSEHYQEASFGLHQYSGVQRTAFGQLSWAKKTDKVNELLLGAAYRMNYYGDNTSLSVDTLTGGNMMHTAGIFMEDELTIVPRHILLLGARFDYNTHTGPVFTPRANYKWNSKDESNIVRIGIGSGYRIPNLLNEGFGALNGSRQIIVTEKLKPETVINANIDYNRIQKLGGGILNIDANVFYTYFFNIIDPDYGDDGYIKYANKTGGAMAPGFSINTDFTFNYPLKVGVGFTYTHVTEKDEDDNGNPITIAPVHSIPFMADFYLSYKFPAPQLSLDWTGNLISPMRLATVTNDQRPGESSWFTIQNIQVTKRFNNGIEVYIGIKNLFNFYQKETILRPFDPFNRYVNVNNPNNYHFDTTYGFIATEGIKGFVGFRYTLL